MSPVRIFQILYSLPFVLTFFFHSITSFITSLISVQCYQALVHHPDLHAPYTALQLDMHKLFRMAEYLQVYGSAYLYPAPIKCQGLKPERMQETFICEPAAVCHCISSSTQTRLECLHTAPNYSWTGTYPGPSIPTEAQKSISPIC